MSSPYGPSGGNEPQQPWGQQPYGGQPGTPAGGFPAQGGGYPQQQPGYQPTQQYPAGGFQQYGQPGGFAPQPGLPGATPEKKSRTWLWVLIIVGVLVVGAVGVLGFYKPGFFVPRVFDKTAVETGVKGILTDKYNIEKVESVSCPSGEPVKKDHTFSCKATIAGEERTVNITVRSEDKGEYEVAPPSDK